MGNKIDAPSADLINPDILAAEIKKRCAGKLPPGLTTDMLATLMQRLKERGRDEGEDVLEISGEALQELGLGDALAGLPPDLIDNVVAKLSGRSMENAADLAPELLTMLAAKNTKEMRKLVGPPPIKRTGEQVGRNDPCTCGSGRKFKKCCGGRH